MYVERKWDFQIRIFRVFNSLLITKTVKKSMESTLFGNTLRKTCPLSVLSYLCNKTLQKLQKTLTNNTNTTKNYKKKYFLSFIRTKYVEMKRHYEKHVLWGFWSFLGTITLKRMNKNLNEKKACILNISLLRAITSECVQNSLYEEWKHYPKCVFWVFINVLGTKSLKNTERILFGKKETTLLKAVPLSVFELFLYENAKMHAKHTLRRNTITLPNACMFRVFELVTYQNDKMHEKYPILGNERTLL